MRCAAIALALLALVATAARAADTAPNCTVTGTNGSPQPELSEVQLNCIGIGETVGRQLADLLSRIIQDRLDPALVFAKLDEVDKIPEEGVARSLDDVQRQQLIHILNGQPPAQIAVSAHPAVEDSAEFAKQIATTLLSVGWQIEGQQIKRTAPPTLDAVHGIAIAVRDRNAAPPYALRLKAALNAVRIGAALVSDPSMSPDAALLWIGRRRIIARGK